MPMSVICLAEEDILANRDRVQTSLSSNEKRNWCKKGYNIKTPATNRIYENFYIERNIIFKNIRFNIGLSFYMSTSRRVFLDYYRILFEIDDESCQITLT